MSNNVIKNNNNSTKYFLGILIPVVLGILIIEIRLRILETN